jgi:hypothetical protein
MILLKELATSQTFKVIPRSYTATSMTFTHEETGVVLTYSISPTTDRYYLSISKIIALKDNHFYTLNILNNTTVVYTDKVFVTNQSIQTYSINNGEYVQSSSNNDYVVYE